MSCYHPDTCVGCHVKIALLTLSRGHRVVLRSFSDGAVSRHSTYAALEEMENNLEIARGVSVNRDLRKDVGALPACPV